MRLRILEGSIKILKRRVMAERHKALFQTPASKRKRRTPPSLDKDLLQLTAAEIQPQKKPAPGTFPGFGFESAFDDIRRRPR